MNTIEQKRKAFKKALKDTTYDVGVTIGSYVGDLIKQNKRYREALERISEHEVYAIEIRCGEELTTDAGKIAEKALEDD